MRNLSWERLVLPLLAALTFLAFCQVGEFDFVNYDDARYVYKNPHLEAGLGSAGITWSFTTFYFNNWHPLTWLSYLLDYELFGLKPGGYHLTNLLLHVVATLLLFAALRRTTGAVWRSAFVAALFAWHPLHVESVAWVAERKDVLSGAFWMLTLWAYALYAARPSAWRYLGVAASLALGLMAKPMLVTLPFVLLLLDYWPLGRFADPDSPGLVDRSRIRPLLLEKLPLLLLVAGSSWITVVAQGGALAKINELPLALRAGNALLAYVAYVGKTVWPQGLAVFYPHPGTSLSIGPVLAASALLAVASFCAIRFRSRRPYLTVGWLWYVGTLVPVIGLVQVGVQGMADRYTYIPLVGLFIAGAWGGAELLEMCRVPRLWRGTGAVAVLSALFFATWLQVTHWSGSLAIFEHALGVTDDNSIAHFNLAAAHMKRGNVDKAAVHYAESLRINERAFLVHGRLGGVLAHQGLMEEARRHGAAALWLIFEMDVGPKHGWPWNDETGGPERPPLHVERGIALARRGVMKDAIVEFEEALRLDPSSVDARLGLGTALLTQDRREDAIRHYVEALRLRPDYASGHYKLGIALLKEHRWDEAVEHLTIASRTQPDHRGVHYFIQMIERHRDDA